MSREILDCLKRQRDICVENVIPSQNTAFMFTPALIGPLEQYLAENISLQRYNCILFELTDIVALFVTKPDFSDLGCSFWHVFS